jgi:hypothetical protein
MWVIIAVLQISGRLRYDIFMIVLDPLGGGLGPIQAILGNNLTAAAATAILPITSTMANLGIPLTGSTAIGLTLGFLKG